MHSVFFWGSKFIGHLEEFFSEETYRKNQLINVSPISDYHYISQKNGMAEWLRELDEIWRKEKPEYLVLDLYDVHRLLYQAEEHLITLALQNAEKVYPGEIISPVAFDWKKIYQKLNLFIEVIKTHFDSSHIILIKTFVPQFYVIDTQLRQLQKTGRRHSRRMQDMYIVGKAEAYFIKQTDAVALELTKFYFYEKEAGYELTDYIYEKECFQDISGKLNNYILRGRTMIMDEFMKPDFSLCLKRYCKYYDCTIFFDAFSVFLDKRNLVENMILSSPKEFVLRHIEELTEWHKASLDTSNIADVFSEQPKTDVMEILLAYNALMQEDYVNEAIDYKILFRNEVVFQGALSRIRECCQEQKIVDGKLINLHNAGYYFARMQGKSDEEAAGFVNDKAIMYPVMVDIFGSCITRTCLRDRFTGNHICAINNCWFQAPAYYAVEHPIPYPAEIFANKKLEVRDQCVKMQFDNSISQAIEKSDAQWLIVDLYALITPATYQYHGLVYTDQHGKISRELGAERIDIHEDASIMGNADEILQKILPWCDCVKRKYKNRIILVDVNYSPFFLGDDNVIYEVYEREKTEKKSEFVKKAYDLVSSQLDCYCIKISDHFLSDEKGYLDKRAVHYELCFYQCVFNIVKEIITEEPEQKLFDSYPAEVKMNRILRLLPGNDPRFLKRYFPCNVDNWVLQLPVRLIDKYYDQIKGWYDQEITDRKMLLRRYEENFEYKDLADAIRKMEDIISCDDSCVLPRAYKQYDDDRFLQGIKVPEIKSFTVIFDGNGADSGCMKPLKVVWGVRTKLTKNNFQKQGYQFAGWRAERKSDGKTCYINQEKRQFYTGGAAAGI